MLILAALIDPQIFISEFCRMSDTSKSVHAPMILKMERICRGYIDQLEKPDGKEFVFQNFMMMYIFGACMNTEYRTKLFDHWPTVSYHENFLH